MKHSKQSKTACLIGLGLWASLLAQPAQSHGASINYQVAPSVALQAQFDNGDPMAEAQVAIFAPDSPETPWQTGLTDEAGNFSFSPDASQAGEWEVQVRQAGHGTMVTIPVSGEGTIVAATDNGPSTAQKLLMTGLGLWGFIGTGLYFSNRSKGQAKHPGQAQADADTSALEPPIPV